MLRIKSALKSINILHKSSLSSTWLHCSSGRLRLIGQHFLDSEKMKMKVSNELPDSSPSGVAGVHSCGSNAGVFSQEIWTVKASTCILGNANGPPVFHVCSCGIRNLAKFVAANWAACKAVYEKSVNETGQAGVLQASAGRHPASHHFSLDTII